MKTQRYSVLAGMLAIAMLQFATVSSLAQTVATNGNILIVNNFDTAYQVTNNGGFAWQNWYGTAYSNVLWSTDDASNNPNSGCLEIVSYFPDAGVGGNYGPQFLAINGFGPFNPGLAGNGASTNYVVTNFECDVRILPFSVTNSSGQYPLLEFGTMTSNYSTAFDFGTLQLTSSQTNWMHVSLPLAPSANWISIPGVFIKSYSTLTGEDVVEVDNIHFDYGTVNITPPPMTIGKASAGLRIYAGSTGTIYDREELTSIDHNQSWVGGSYPVTYSVTFNSFARPNATNENLVYHMFLIPMNSAGGNSFNNNQYIDYQANNDLWLEIQANSTSNVVADVSWKTNLPNANPNVTVAMLTNSTAIGTWTLTFNSATTGTLTAPGGASANFTLADGTTIATDFGNPLVAFFGIQPNSGWGEGQYVDVAHISTAGIASPGVPINDNFTTDTNINTAVWDVSNSVNTNSLVQVTTNGAWWVSWAGPAVAFGLGTKADIGNSSIPWKTPNYYADYATSAPFAPLSQAEGPVIASLIPYNALPTVNGLSNGVTSANAFFRLSRPAPAQ